MSLKGTNVNSPGFLLFFGYPGLGIDQKFGPRMGPTLKCLCDPFRVGLSFFLWYHGFHPRLFTLKPFQGQNKDYYQIKITRYGRRFYCLIPFNNNNENRFSENEYEWLFNSHINSTLEFWLKDCEEYCFVDFIILESGKIEFYSLDHVFKCKALWCYMS